jgi:hypothetical protein
MPQIKGLQAKVLSSNLKRVQLVDVTTAGMTATHTFKFQGENLIYVIQSIIAANELELVVTYGGARPPDVFHPFQISTDFTVNVGLIKLAAGDVDIRDYLSRNFDRIDQLFDLRWYVDNDAGDLVPDGDAGRNLGSDAGQRVNQVHLATFLQVGETSDPAAPPTNRARVYLRDNGAGKSQLCVRFPTGAVQVVATEP